MMRLLILFIVCSPLLVAGTVAAAEKEPIIKVVRVEPLQFNAVTGLTIEPILEDAAGDYYSFEYRWFLNGEESLFETTEKFPGELLRRDDEISVEVTPIDSSGNKLAPYVTLPLRAVNASPAIGSVPPTRFSNQGFRYRVAATDPDGDTVSYHLEEGPENMLIDSSTGELTWVFEQLPEGSFPVLIVAEDNFGGRAEQRFELNLSFVPKGEAKNE
ncbi:MAG: hypothetical protein GQ578_06680 [Desulfuromonadaceae bacterium]|nr:hypothetical protein [Desulfuromonadaceae bacterium]